MARVTVEDCIDKVENRFELVALASQRARNIASGAVLTIDRDNDKDAVIALREIAQGTVLIEHLKEELIKSYQTTADEDKLEQMEGGTSSIGLPEEGLSEISDEIKSLEVPDTDANQGFSEDNGDAGGSFADENLDVDD